jgi:hypothetical protein
MKLTIDNFDGNGPRDYSTVVDSEHMPHIQRQLNRPAQLHAALIAAGSDFVVPAAGGRVLISRDNGETVYTGYVSANPTYEYLGWGEAGPVYRYDLSAVSDEWLLDSKTLPQRAAFVNRTAGAILKQMASDLAPSTFDISAVQDIATLLIYSAVSQKTWSQHAAEVALQCRASYRAQGSALRLEPVGAVQHVLDEADPSYSPDQLVLTSSGPWANDATLFGRVEPRAYVKNYFLGDGSSLRFYLSDIPYSGSSSVFLDEEYQDATLRSEWWSRLDPANAISVSGGKLRVAGGTGNMGATSVSFVDPLEIGGALLLQHGDVSFSAASNGILGGLYYGGFAQSNCMAGFSILPSGPESTIAAVVNGVLAGTPITTVAGRHYVLTTRIYARENYRRGPTFYSSAHPAGNGRGNASTASAVRVVLEAHEINPNNTASLIAPSTVLYDDVLSNLPDFCMYALINAADMHCDIAFTRLLRAVDAEVRSAASGEGYRTRLVGSLSDGAECQVTQSAELWFYSAYAPASDEKIVVSYRGSRRAQARLLDPQSIAGEARGQDNGSRGTVKNIAAPLARTSEDCRNAALALLDDATQTAWSGVYAAWSDFLPSGSSDVFPGEALVVHAPSRNADFSAVVRAVEISVLDFDSERLQYRISFANDAAELLALSLEQPSGFYSVPDPIPIGIIPSLPASMASAEVTGVSSTDVTVDAFADPPAGGGFEVRWSDAGWGPDNDRNLIGRFTTRTFSLARLSRTQTYYLRAFDASAPPLYSLDSAVLHIDYPL